MDRTRPMPAACGSPSASTGCSSPKVKRWRRQRMSSAPGTRPEYVREQVDERQFGVVNQPLTAWDRVYGNAFVRKAAILVVLAAVWQAYAMHLDNSLVMPTFMDTLAAFVQRIESGELLR